MKETNQTHPTTIPEYSVRISSRAKYLRLTIYRDKGLIVTVPIIFDHQKIKEFVMTRTDWILKKLEYFKTNHYVKEDRRKEYIQLKERARDLVKERLAKYNTIYNLPYKGISIKSQKTLWGSCSRHGNLNFNYKIIKLPEELADYIIVHELCHLQEFNHSKRFWNLVAKAIPNYKMLRKELKLIKC